MGRLAYKFYIMIANILISESTDVVIQEGSTYTSLYSGSINYRCDTFVWIRKDAHIQQCYSDKNSIDYVCNQPPFTRKVETNVIVNNNVATTNLTIVNVYKNGNDSDEGAWSFRCDAPSVSTITSFVLKLYQKPRSLQCTYLFESNGLTVTCSSQGTYPQAKVFAQTTHSSGIISSCQNVLDSSNLYYNATCAFKFLTASLRIGKIEVNMTVYPNVTALISDIYFGESRLLTLNLEIPKISLTNCPEKDIIEDTTFSCTCERSDVSDILTNTRWLINGTEYSSSSSTNSVLNNVASRYRTNYTCSSVNVLGWNSSPFIYIPSVLYPSEIINLLINEKEQNQTVIDNQSMLRILCKAIGNPEPSLYLAKDGNQLVAPTKNNFTLSLNYTANCMDSGKFICSADNKIGETSHKTSTVFVKCPQQLQDPSTNERVLTATERNNVSLNITVFGYPKPDMYVLIRNDINKLTVNGSILQTNVLRKYSVAYHADDQNLIYGNVTFTVFNMSSEDFANYTLIIYNGEKGSLTYKLTIEYAESSKTSNSITGAIVGGCVGAFVAIVLTSIIILLIRRKQCFKCKEKEQKTIELSSQTINNDTSIANSNTRFVKKKKTLKSKKDDKDVAEKLDSIINVLRSLETRQKILENKLNSPSERRDNTGEVAREAQYDILRQPVDSIDYAERTYAIVNTNAYQEITLETEKKNYENIV